MKHINDELIELKKDINRKNIPGNENPNKIVNIVEKILVFNKQQKGKGPSSYIACVVHIAKVSDRKHFKILSPKQMLQILPIALAQVKVGNTSEKLLNKIRQIIHFLY